MRPNIDPGTVEKLEKRADAIAGLDASELGVGKQIEIVLDELDGEKNAHLSTKQRMGGEWYER